MIKNLKKPLKIQGMIGLVAILLFTAYYVSQGLDFNEVKFQTSAAVYGFFIGVMNVLMLGVTFKKANDKAAEDPKTGILILYMSAVIRFILLAVLFILGLSLFKFEPMPVVMTFVVMQIGQMFNLTGKRRLTD